MAEICNHPSGLIAISHAAIQFDNSGYATHKSEKSDLVNGKQKTEPMQRKSCMY